MSATNNSINDQADLLKPHERSKVTKGLGRYITITPSEGNYHPQRMSDSSSMGKRSIEEMMDTEKSLLPEESMVSRLSCCFFAARLKAILSHSISMYRYLGY
jgi:hypothetical protein